MLAGPYPRHPQHPSPRHDAYDYAYGPGTHPTDARKHLGALSHTQMTMFEAEALLPLAAPGPVSMYYVGDMQQPRAQGHDLDLPLVSVPQHSLHADDHAHARAIMGDEANVDGDISDFLLAFDDEAAHPPSSQAEADHLDEFLMAFELEADGPVPNPDPKHHGNRNGADWQTLSFSGLEYINVSGLYNHNHPPSHVVPGAGAVHAYSNTDPRGVAGVENPYPPPGMSGYLPSWTVQNPGDSSASVVAASAPTGTPIRSSETFGSVTLPGPVPAPRRSSSLASLVLTLPQVSLPHAPPSAVLSRAVSEYAVNNAPPGTAAYRQVAIRRWMEKRKRRKFGKQRLPDPEFEGRRKIASRRPRVKGRFVKEYPTFLPVPL